MGEEEDGASYRENKKEMNEVNGDLRVTRTVGPTTLYYAFTRDGSIFVD